mgnify:CR=1 FL=1
MFLISSGDSLLISIVPALLALIAFIVPNRFAVSLCATIGLLPAYTRSS